MKRPTRKDYRRFFLNVTVSDLGCWLWDGCRSGNGHGSFCFDYYATTAHRIAYLWFVAPIADGLVIDHLCRTKRCVNPAHLEAVTQSENLRRDCAIRRMTP
jgi:hypothetical protein